MPAASKPDGKNGKELELLKLAIGRLEWQDGFPASR